MANIEKLVPFILRWEGGYVNDPADRGGETNKGITIATWASFGHDTAEKIPEVTDGKRTYRNVTRSLYEMTDDQWKEILRKGYWDRWRADNIGNQSIANILVDWVWASGIHGIKRPQELIGVTPDGIVGPRTLEAVNDRSPEQLFSDLRFARHRFVENIVKRNPSQAKFLRGWKRRIDDISYEP